MKELVEKAFSTVTLLLAIAMLVIGVVLLVFPTDSLFVTVMVLGIALIVYGLVSGIAFLVQKEEQRSGWKLLIGIVAAVFGIVIVLWPGAVLNFFPTAAGCAVIAFGLLSAFQAIRARKENPEWVRTLVLGLVTAVLGGIILLRRFDEATIIRMLGTILLYVGAFRIVPICRT